MSKIFLEHVVKKYGYITALNDLSLECQDREFVVILGPSGAGKTSTLRMIAGVEAITSGNIWFDDQLVNEMPPGERETAMVFENYNLYPHMTVFDNLAYPLRVPKRAASYAKEDVTEQVHRIANMLGIDTLLNRMPDQLSGGQKQRVSLGRAMVRMPKVFLLDEPIAHLDAKLRHQLRAEFKRLSREFNSTIIYVTHDYKEALSLGDKVAIIKKGELQQVGTPEQIFSEPANTFVADMIGEPAMNLIPAKLLIEQERLFCTAKGFKIELGDYERQAVLSCGKNVSQVYIGIRPMYLSIANGSENKDAISGEIYITEPLGYKTQISVQINKQLFYVIVTGDYSYSIGDKIVLIPNKQKILLFDRENGRRITIV